MKTLKFSLLAILLFCSKETQQELETKLQDSQIKKTKPSNLVRLGTLEWQPYVGSDLTNYGYVFELVQKSLELEGLKTEIEFYPFARLFPLMESGELDGYFPEYWNEDLAKTYDYSDPLPGGDLGFMKLKKQKFDFTPQANMQDFHSLASLKIGVVRGYTNTRAFDSANYLQKEETASDLNNLKKLLFNRIDLILIDPNVANYLIQTNLPNKKELFEYLEPSLEYKPLYVCFKKSEKKLFLKKFNEGLKKLESTGELKNILEKNHFVNGRYEYDRSK